MIILSAHIDMVKDLTLKYDKGILSGLLDDFLGILCLFHSLLSEKELIAMEKRGELKIYFNDGEEFGKLNNPPQVNKGDTVICVDVADTPICSLENISGFKDDDLKALKEDLEWEGFKFKMKKYTGNREDMDDGCLWEGKCRSISYILPAKGNWHTNSWIKIEDLKNAIRLLTRMICYLS